MRNNRPFLAAIARMVNGLKRPVNRRRKGTFKATQSIVTLTVNRPFGAFRDSIADPPPATGSFSRRGLPGICGIIFDPVLAKYPRESLPIRPLGFPPRCPFCTGDHDVRERVFG
jgi:hypothetical protein